MSFERTHAHARAKARYLKLLDEYEEAVRTCAVSLEDAFARVEQAWGHLREIGMSEAAASQEMYLVSMFSIAVQAGHAAEAERIYARMGDDYRCAVDAADALGLGRMRMKIWVRE